jgi:2-keto-4-pentenoate hydratase/2-oxohepta-3-ene-1,7-dioic acid hydratase in catechol pathway
MLTPREIFRMQFVRYTTDGAPMWGVRDGGTIHSLSARPAGAPSLDEIGDERYRGEVRNAVERGGLPTVPAAEVSLLSPVPRPGKIVCVGLNYKDHAEEQDEELPERPLLFGKAPTAVTDPGAPIVVPEEIDEPDYEVELGIVIGRTATDVSATEARDYIAGYTVVHDVSARDAQFADEQFLRGKSYDTFAPMGPTLVAGDGFDPNDAAGALRVNGETKQESSTAQFIFDVDELVEYISHAMTLRPGDVISTGTPGGVGIFRDPPDLLEDGDITEAEIEGIGTLQNHVVAE